MWSRRWKPVWLWHKGAFLYNRLPALAADEWQCVVVTWLPGFSLEMVDVNERVEAGVESTEGTEARKILVCRLVGCYCWYHLHKNFYLSHTCVCVCVCLCVSVCVCVRALTCTYCIPGVAACSVPWPWPLSLSVLALTCWHIIISRVVMPCAMPLMPLGAITLGFLVF